MVGAGAVVTRSVPPNAIVVGNPGRIAGYVDGQPSQALPEREQSAARPLVKPTGISTVAIHSLPEIRDIRGNLTVGEFDRGIPFVPRRYFIVHGVPSKETRGEHAHRTCHQFLICVYGSCAMVVDDGRRRLEMTLDSPSLGVYVPPMVWGIQYKYTADAMLLVFASEHYDPSDYIRDYSEFRQLVQAQEAGSRRT